MPKSYSLLCLFVAVMLFTSCEKTEGEGGTAEITGKVYLIRFDGGYTVPMDTVPASDEDVYIIYGKDHTIYDDDFKTSYDGSYRFKYLLKGTYKVFVYTNDSTGAHLGLANGSNPGVPIFRDVNIGTGESATVQDIFIIDNDL